MTPLVSPVIQTLPNPVDPTVSSLGVPRYHPGRTLLAAMVAMKLARLRCHSLAEPIAGRGQLCWCPGWLLWLLYADLRPGGGFIVQVDNWTLIKPLVFLSSTSDFELFEDQEVIG